MRPAYFGIAKKRLTSIARRLGGKKASSGAYAIDVDGIRILYRHASFDNRASGYCHWNWDWPFGKSRREQSNVDYFLLHASKPKQTFFLIPFAKRPRRGLPRDDGFQVNPINQSNNRDRYEPFRKSIAEIKQIICSKRKLE